MSLLFYFNNLRQFDTIGSNYVKTYLLPLNYFILRYKEANISVFFINRLRIVNIVGQNLIEQKYKNKINMKSILMMTFAVVNIYFF
jgi:hypothetical protein